MLVLSQIYQGMIFFFITLQKRNEKEWEKKIFLMNGNILLGNKKLNVLHFLVTIQNRKYFLYTKCLFFFFG